MKINSCLALIFFLLFPSSILFSQNDNLSAKTEIIIPATLNDSFRYLDSLFSDSTKLEIRSMQELEFSSSMHFGLGMWMRNNWGLWQGTSNLYHFFIKKGIWHADDMSGIILRSYYRHLTGKKIKLAHQFRKSKKYYKKAKKKEDAPKITAFTSSGTKYKSLESALANSDSIISLTLDDFVKIPKKIKHFKNLQELEIENSPNLDLDEATNILIKLDSLKELSFWNSERKDYPVQLGSLVNLEVLWISGDSITELPSFIPKLHKLKDLYIGNCPKVNFINLIEKLTVLENLEELDLSENKLQTIPHNINKLRQLKKLYLSDNKITEINDATKSMHTLTTLDLFDNEIKTITLKAGELTNLEDINLCYNEFEKFPIELTKLRKLRKIMIWHNNISEVSESIGDFKNLEILHLTNNQLDKKTKDMIKSKLSNTNVFLDK